MFDIDYVLDPQEFSQTMVYRYQTGVLLPKVRRALKQYADEQRPPRMVMVCGPREKGRFSPTHLMPTLTVCQWAPTEPKSLSASEVAWNLQELAAGRGGRTVHLVKLDRTTRDSKYWPDIEKSCFVIDEPQVTIDTLKPILRYLDATTPLLDRPNLTDQPGFVESFFELLDRPSSDLTDVMLAYNERVLTCVDMIGQRFFKERYNRQSKEEFGSSSPYGYLQRLVQAGGRSSVVSLVTALRARSTERGWSPGEVIDQLLRLTWHLIGNAVRSMGYSIAARKPMEALEDLDGFANLALWCAVLVAWEERLRCALKYQSTGFSRGPDTVFYTIDQLCRDFLKRRESARREDDPLYNLWDAIHDSMIGVQFNGRARRANVKAELLHSLLQHDKASEKRRHPGWLAVLLARIRDGVEKAELERDTSDELELGAQGGALGGKRAGASGLPSQQSSASLIIPPMRFPDIVGRGAVVEALRRLVRQDDLLTHVILYGPEGVGRSMLARLLAKAILCPHSKADGEPCNICANCRSFLTGGAFGYSYFNAAIGRRESDANTNSVFANANSSTLADRSVVFVENVDALTSVAFDKLLKTLEDQASTFIFTALDLGKVRPAIRSRCIERRVGRLTDDETRMQLQLLLNSEGIGFDKPTIDILVALSLGLPSEIKGIVGTLSGFQILSTAAVREFFQLNWPEHVGFSWCERVMAGLRLDEDVSPSHVERREELRRWRSMILHIPGMLSSCCQSNQDVSDPAFLHMSPDAMAALCAEFEAIARRYELSVSELHLHLADTLSR